MDGINQEFVFGSIPISRADRMPCPVCGHSTGDCTVSGAEPKHIIGFGIFKSVDKHLDFTVEEDIYEERQLNPHYTAKVLLARKGQKISLDRARELGLL